MRVNLRHHVMGFRMEIATPCELPAGSCACVSCGQGRRYYAVIIVDRFQRAPQCRLGWRLSWSVCLQNHFQALVIDLQAVDGWPIALVPECRCLLVLVESISSLAHSSTGGFST